MSCTTGLHDGISKILNNKPWFNYKQGDTVINIVDSPAKRINKNTSIGVARTVAGTINKLLNNLYPNLGEILVPFFNPQGRGTIRIQPSNKQLDYINATDEKEIEEYRKELEQKQAENQQKEDAIRAGVEYNNDYLFNNELKNEINPTNISGEISSRNDSAKMDELSDNYKFNNSKQFNSFKILETEKDRIQDSSLYKRVAGKSFNEVWQDESFTEEEQKTLLLHSIKERLSDTNSFNGKVVEKLNKNSKEILGISLNYNKIAAATKGKLLLNIDNIYDFIKNGNMNPSEYINYMLGEELIHLVSFEVLTKEDYYNILNKDLKRITQGVNGFYESNFDFSDVNSINNIGLEYIRAAVQKEFFGKTTEDIKYEYNSYMKQHLAKIWEYLKDLFTSVSTKQAIQKHIDYINSNVQFQNEVTQAETDEVLSPIKKENFIQFLQGKLDGSKMFNEIEGKLEANKDRLIDLLGSSMYSEKLKDVVYKELLQNAFDAAKIAEARGLIDKGKVDININEKERIITFTDNGIGMTSDIVQKAFFTIGGTYKGDDVDNKLKSGGLGLAKMAFIFGSEQLILETVHNGIKTTVNATSREIRNDNFKIRTESTSQKNGTQVSVKIPKIYVNGKGENREIDFPLFIDSELEYSFLQNPLIGNIDVNYSLTNRESSYRKDEKIKTNLGKIPEGYVLFSPASTSFADMDIYIDTKSITRGRFDTKHKILSSGLYQFDVNFKTQDDETIPLNIIIDVKPKVDATNAQYPFNNQREDFKPTVKNDIGALNKYLQLLWHSIEIELLKNTFSKIKNINKLDIENVDNALILKNQEITKEFTKQVNSDIIIKAIKDFNKENEKAEIKDGGVKTKTQSFTKEDIDKDTEKAYDRTFKAEKNIKIDKETGLSLDSNKPIVHNNTTMVFNTKATQFLSEISSIMFEYKQSIIDFYGEDYSDNLKTQLWGVSIDKQYGGVNVNPSFVNMLAINPFYQLPNNPKVDAVNYIAVALDHLIIHELNHNFERNEGAGFTGRFLKTYSEIHSLPNHFELISKLKLSIKNNLETIKILNYEYEQSENVESGFEGNKLETNNKKGTDNGDESVSENDTSRNERTKTNDSRSSDSIGEQLNSNQAISDMDKFVNKTQFQNKDNNSLLDITNTVNNEEKLTDILKKIKEQYNYVITNINELLEFLDNNDIRKELSTTFYNNTLLDTLNILDIKESSQLYTNLVDKYSIVNEEQIFEKLNETELDRYKEISKEFFNNKEIWKNSDSLEDYINFRDIVIEPFDKSVILQYNKYLFEKEVNGQQETCK